MDRIDPTPTTATLLAATALHLAETPHTYLGPMDIARAVLTIAPDLTVVQLRPVWETLPTAGDTPRHDAYATRLWATATDSDPDMDEALRRARAPRQAVAA